MSFATGFSSKLAYPTLGNVLAEGTTASLTPLQGSRIKLRLVTPVSSKAPSGSSFQARIEEPLSNEGRVLLPQGTLFEGILNRNAQDA